MELLFVDVSLLDSEVLLYSGPCNDSQHCGRRIVDWNVRAWCLPPPSGGDQTCKCLHVMSTSIYIGTWTLSRTVALIFGGQESAYWGLNWSAVQAEGTLSRGKNQAWLDFKLSSAGPRLYSLLVSRCSGWWYLVVMMNMLLMMMSVLTNIN